ncbi:MAG TPA: peptide-methionine (S)-S-oxide reductase MsrA [Gemmatimonadota bacterium]|nr:peptide-methionine (S)-S-oxide reductase MsrA [Gemmatimonadota bacterium]
MKTGIVIVLVLAGGLAAVLLADGSAARRPEPRSASIELSTDPNDDVSRQSVATFAGGCFWCVEEAFDEVKGVVSTTSGYTGGHTKDPSYDEVTVGDTGHFEAVRVRYDPAVVSYRQLLDAFWRNIDPTDRGGQFCDRGDSYRSAIFYHDPDQKRLAEASRRAIEESRLFQGPIVTEIVAAGEFYPAEEYHQNYYQKNPIRYKFYKWNCGRAARLEELWGEKS